MKSFNSPYIVEVYKLDSDSNEYTMEFMDQTLHKFISKNNNKLSFINRKNIGNQILKAFSYIHSKKLFHRDISPSNVLIKIYDDTFVVKVSDFGLVKNPESQLTSYTSELKGYFNDPSLLVEGFDSYNMLHETFALTRLLFFVITGRTNTDNIKNKTLKTFVETGLHHDKNKRYLNCEAIKKAFNNLAEL